MHTHMKKKHSKEWEIQDVVALKTEPVGFPSESDHMHVQEEQHQSRKDVAPNMEKSIAMDENYEADTEQAFFQHTATQSNYSHHIDNDIQEDVPVKSETKETPASTEGVLLHPPPSSQPGPGPGPCR